MLLAPLNMPQCQRLANAKGLKNSKRILCRKNIERLCSIKLSFSSFLRMDVLLGIFSSFRSISPPTESPLTGQTGCQAGASFGSQEGRDGTRVRAGGRGECECESENSPAGPEALAGDSAAESSQSPAAGNGEGIERFPVCISKCENIIATTAVSSLRIGVSNDANILFPLSLFPMPQYRMVPCGFLVMNDPRVTPPQPARKGEPFTQPRDLQD
ncbi:uncharacterized protein LOC116582341 [Mustela erminea]|uniref:uncharacterized protein LOC116582341 n=1 Tax=Mustela erminea TaxID=36723 RepID=UPI0013871AAF|nr:uncharacterized protein LOC116582341 [Mustela erminea]